MIKELIYGGFVKEAIKIEFSQKKLIPPQQPGQQAQMPQQLGAGPAPQVTGASAPVDGAVGGSPHGQLPQQPTQPGPVQGGQAPFVAGQQAAKQLPVAKLPVRRQCQISSRKPSLNPNRRHRLHSPRNQLNNRSQRHRNRNLILKGHLRSNQGRTFHK